MGCCCACWHFYFGPETVKIFYALCVTKRHGGQASREEQKPKQEAWKGTHDKDLLTWCSQLKAVKWTGLVALVDTISPTSSRSATRKILCALVDCNGYT